MITGRAPGGFHAFVRPGRRLSEGEALRCGSGQLVLLARHPDGTWLVRAEPGIEALAETAGEVPLPPYLDRPPTEADVERYQTVYARAGDLRASAAPTAGLHFTPGLLDALAAKGVEVHRVTLEVGAGTFQPLDLLAWEAGRLHSERYTVPLATYDAVTQARRRGSRVVAVGTTTVRVLESMAGWGAGSTDLFIRPGYRFRYVDALITNFHLPRSSLLMLVTAFGGLEPVMAAYADAVRSGFRFYSYGDAMWLERDPSAGP
jgi:S-adenosylmethionine:tRNA ribosyltransferase-isomerase